MTVSPSQLGTVRPGVLVLAAGAAWEAQCLPALAASGIAVLKRCVDTADLMATATAGTAAVALVDGDAPGLDGDAVRHLLQHGTRTVAVVHGEAAPAAERLYRLGVVAAVAPDPSGPTAIVAAVHEAVRVEPVRDPLAEADDVGALETPGEVGDVTVVWGPTGAPGRTTVAIGLASVWASSGRPTVLVDLDPHGGAVAQHLGVLDEVSGVLATARLANAGRLDRAAFARSASRVGDGLVVLSGLPRGDRRSEVRPGAVEGILEQGIAFGDVVVDVGFGVEDDDLAPSRDRMTLDALAQAEKVVVVGSAEPTGLSRLARALVDLAEVAPGIPVHVVVNRMRPSLGWSERDITGMVEGYARAESTTFLPLDQATVDRALVDGRSVVEAGDSALKRALGVLAARVRPQPPKSR